MYCHALSREGSCAVENLPTERSGRIAISERERTRAVALPAAGLIEGIDGAEMGVTGRELSMPRAPDDDGGGGAGMPGVPGSA